MPNRDRTGPEGLGPVIGRRGGGRGMGRGCKNGNGRKYCPPVDREASLNAEKDMLKRRLAEIENLMEKSE